MDTLQRELQTKEDPMPFSTDQAADKGAAIA